MTPSIDEQIEMARSWPSSEGRLMSLLAIACGALEYFQTVMPHENNEKLLAAAYEEMGLLPAVVKKKLKRSEIKRVK